MASNRQQTLSAPPVPTLPDPKSVYAEKTVRVSNSLVRTFMLRLTGALQSLFGPNGGQYIECPNGLFFNTADQTFAVTNTAYPVVFSTTYLSNAVHLQSGSTSRIEVSVGGIYNFQYSGQVLSDSGSAKELAIWIRRDGTDIGYSTRVFTDSDNNHRNTKTGTLTLTCKLDSTLRSWRRSQVPICGLTRLLRPHHAPVYRRLC